MITLSAIIWLVHLDCFGALDHLNPSVASVEGVQAASMAAKFDDSTPEGALRAFAKAIQTGDEAGMRALTRAETLEQKLALEARLPAWAQIVPFYDALYGVFGHQRVNRETSGYVGMFFGGLAIDPDGENVELVVCGDFAVIARMRDAIRQKLIRENGHWKIYFDEWDEEYVLMNLASKPLAEALRQTTPEILVGIYKTPKEAEDALMRRFEAAQPGAEKGGGD